MKKLLLLLSLIILSVESYGTSWIKTAVSQNGIWYPWEKASYVTMSGTYNQFVVHDVLEGPSHYYFRITINNFYIPDKKTRKSHIKNNEWYEFSGYIEYWIDDDHMDFLSCLPSYGRTIPIEAVPWLHFDGRPSIIKKSQATIKIQPYEKHPELWNIWFEGIGYAFYFYQTNYY